MRGKPHYNILPMVLSSAKKAALLIPDRHISVRRDLAYWLQSNLYLVQMIICKASFEMYLLTLLL